MHLTHVPHYKLIEKVSISLLEHLFSDYQMTKELFPSRIRPKPRKMILSFVRILLLHCLLNNTAQPKVCLIPYLSPGETLFQFLLL